MNVNENRGIERSRRLTPRELGEIEGKSYDTVLRWVNDGINGVKLPSYRVVRNVFVTWGDYQDWLKRVAESYEQARLRLREALREARGRSRRVRKATERLASQGAI